MGLNQVASRGDKARQPHLLFLPELALCAAASGCCSPWEAISSSGISCCCYGPWQAG